MSPEAPAAEAVSSPDAPRKPTEKEAMFFLTILGAMKNKPEVSHAISSSISLSKIPKIHDQAIP
jgi:hypothetical protein